MPWSIAVASVKGLNALPAVRPDCDARLNFIGRPSGRYETIALTAPVRGSMATSAAAGSVFTREDAADRGPCGVLHARVERRAHLQAARLDLLRAEPLHELLRRPAEEVRVALRAVERAGLAARPSRRPPARTACS